MNAANTGKRLTEVSFVSFLLHLVFLLGDAASGQGTKDSDRQEVMEEEYRIMSKTMHRL